MDKELDANLTKECKAVETTGHDLPLRTHSNDNLLKIDTHDLYSTVAAIKKLIAKEAPDATNTTPGQPFLQGIKRMNKNPKTPYLFMAFDSAENRQAALQLLQRMSYRGKPWNELPVTERDLSLTHKGGVKRARTNSEGNKLTEYDIYPIERQLELKRMHCLSVMKSILPSKVYGWETYAKRFLGILESPLTEGYRNHVNLSFGFGENGNPTIGFQTGSLVEGKVTIESAVDPQKNIPTMNAVARVVATSVMGVYESFASHGVTMFDKVKGNGFWRKMQVRHNTLGQVMIDLELDEDSVPTETFEAIKKSLVQALCNPKVEEQLQEVWAAKTAGVISLQYHKHTGIRSLPEDAPRIVLSGSSTLTERLCGTQLEISPTDFFQVNTQGAERMLEKIVEVAELRSSSTLLDLCCGTGTIGLVLSPHVKKVIGIELVKSSVENAQRNAQRNGIHNAVFHAGRVENVLPTIIRNLTLEERKDITAILDPPRAGVNGTVLKWIRGTSTIRRVVYISCEQKALERDCAGLMKPETKAYRCEPFEVTAAFAVDLFPHTHHVEMIVVLTRREITPEGGAPKVGDDEPPTEVSQVEQLSVKE
ncbi:unnamed protein product [Phytomonas sp. EM1]|nr:unnamed protein product [Phytomonas sp. EM1]|eukprot:CCW64501.1 unnamed protein product [Phytomonas sp. isolate EM1]